jgi:restriction system protein
MFTPDHLVTFLWRAFSPVLLLMALLVLAAAMYYVLRRRRLAAAGMPEIDRMTGKDFETKMALLFQAKGYRVEQTPYVGDWGADLVVSHGGERTVAQIKRWNRKVGVRAIQEVVAAKAKYRCQHALVATNSFYTEAARDLARVNGVELWDRDRLAREFLALRGGEAIASLRPATGPDGPGERSPVETRLPRHSSREVRREVSPATPTKCYKCGREMVLKENERGKFWACPGFPRCKNTFPART